MPYYIKVLQVPNASDECYKLLEKGSLYISDGSHSNLKDKLLKEGGYLCGLSEYLEFPTKEEAEDFVARHMGKWIKQHGIEMQVEISNFP